MSDQIKFLFWMFLNKKHLYFLILKVNEMNTIKFIKQNCNLI